MKILKYIIITVILAAIALPGCKNDIQAPNTQKGSLKLHTHVDTLSYSLGISIGRTLKKEGFDRINIKVLAYAINQVLHGVKDDDLQIHPQVADEILKIYLYKEQKRSPKIATAQWRDFLTQNARRPGVKVLSSGLQYEILKQGSGAHPALTDYVEVRYRGYLPDGTVFDDNYQRSPAVFMVGRSLEGWQQALVRMREGSKWRIYLPPYLAFGDKKVRGVPPNSVVIYEIELLNIKHIK